MPALAVTYGLEVTPGPPAWVPWVPTPALGLIESAVGPTASEGTLPIPEVLGPAASAPTAPEDEAGVVASDGAAVESWECGPPGSEGEAPEDDAPDEAPEFAGTLTGEAFQAAVTPLLFEQPAGRVAAGPETKRIAAHYEQC